MSPVIVSSIKNYLSEMNTWQKAAFFPYLFAPVLLLILMISLLTVDGGLLAIVLLIPVLIFSFYTFYLIFQQEFGRDHIHFLVSGGTIVYTILFPYFLVPRGIDISRYLFIYLVVLIPTFLGHVYSIIFFAIQDYSASRKALVIQK